MPVTLDAAADRSTPPPHGETWQADYRRSLEARLNANRKASSRRGWLVLLVVVSLLVLVPVAVIGGLVGLGFVFGKKAILGFERAQDPKRNGMPAVAGEIRAKQAQGCGRVLFGPQIRVHGATEIALPLEATSPCVHLIGATALATTHIKLEQTTQQPLSRTLPPASSSFDFRFCPSRDDTYAFRVTSDNSEPFTVAAIECPRTIAEGLVRSAIGDTTSTGMDELRSWMGSLRGQGCDSAIAEPTVYQGTQVVAIDSRKGGPCLNLLATSHFSDAPLQVTLTSPTGQEIAKPTPAPRVHLQYCPNLTGRHRVEIVPSTRDHYAVAFVDCPRRHQR